MTPWLRRAGEGTVGGVLVRWSVAEGSRGRRWRWTVVHAGALRSTSLLELTPEGGFARLERESSRGLLTVHPEVDGRTLHGNLVRAGGVDPIALPWRPGIGLRIAGDAFGSALCPSVDEVLTAAEDGTVSIAPAPAAALELTLDPRGVPELTDAAEWPLEA